MWGTPAASGAPKLNALRLFSGAFSFYYPCKGRACLYSTGLILSLFPPAALPFAKFPSRLSLMIACYCLLKVVMAIFLEPLS